MTKKKDYDTIFKLFSKNYELVPLEVFHNNPYKTLISTLMSSRTKDETTLEASNRLFEKAPDIKALHKLEQKTISELIYPVGFYKTKSKNIKKLTQIILDDFAGIIPETQKELLQLPGVGVKTANLALNRAFGKPAIAVDTHVHRIVNFLGWVETEKPEETLKELEKKLPKKYWTEMNRLFVSIGRQYTTNKKLEKFLRDNKIL